MIARKRGETLETGTLLNHAYTCNWKEAERQKSLRKQGPENGSGPFGPDPLYTVLRSPTAYSLRCTNSGSCAARASRVLLGGRSRQPATMSTHDTTAAASAPQYHPRGDYYRRYQGWVSTVRQSPHRRLAYQGYQGYPHLRASTGARMRARERPHGRLFFLDILDIHNSNTRKKGGKA